MGKFCNFNGNFDRTRDLKIVGKCIHNRCEHLYLDEILKLALLQLGCCSGKLSKKSAPNIFKVDTISVGKFERPNFETS